MPPAWPAGHYGHRIIAKRGIHPAPLAPTRRHAAQTLYRRGVFGNGEKRPARGHPQVLLQLCLPAAINAQEVKQAPESRLQSPDDAARPNAVTLSVRGKCDFSEDGVAFTNFERGHIFEQGAFIRTGENARTDFFMWQNTTISKTFREPNRSENQPPGICIKAYPIKKLLKTNPVAEAFK